MHPPSFSSYGHASLTPSPAGRMMADFAREFRDGIDINLGVGYVNEATIPRDLIREAFDAVLNSPDKYRVPLNYGGPAGSDNLIEAIRNFIIRNNTGGLTADTLERIRIIVGANGATSLLDGMAQLFEPGIIITADPTYYIYTNFLERMGFTIVAIPEEKDGINIDQLQQVLTELGPRKRDIRFIYMVTVNNPTSTILSNAKRQALVNTATELSEELDQQIPLILDRAYEHLIHDPEAEAPLSGLLYDTRNLVYEIGSFSKILAPALRIGYMLGPKNDLMTAMVQRTSDVGFSAPLINQEIASYIMDNHMQEQIAFVNREYRAKAQPIRQWIDKYLGEYLQECRGGQAAFYFYLTFRNIQTDDQSPFFKFLNRTTGDPKIDGPPGKNKPRVAYIPGQYCVLPKGHLQEIGNRQLRLSYGFEELERIKSAIKLMADAAQYASQPPRS